MQSQLTPNRELVALSDLVGSVQRDYILSFLYEHRELVPPVPQPCAQHRPAAFCQHTHTKKPPNPKYFLHETRTPTQTPNRMGDSGLTQDGVLQCSSQARLPPPMTKPSSLGLGLSDYSVPPPKRLSSVPWQALLAISFLSAPLPLARPPSLLLGSPEERQRSLESIVPSS